MRGLRPLEKKTKRGRGVDEVDGKENVKLGILEKGGGEGMRSMRRDNGAGSK